MADGLGKQLTDLVGLPASLTQNVNRAAEAIIEIRDQLGSLVDLPREILEQLRVMQELAQEMHNTAEELHAVAVPMLETAQSINQLAKPMLETGRSATKAAEEAREAINRTNELAEQMLRIASPLATIQERGRGLRARLRGDQPPPPADDPGKDA
jgi:methyl-accepting chemotaxis protein